MTLESEFKEDPKEFLKGGSTGHVVVVPGSTDADCNAPALYRFCLEAGTRNRVLLLPKTTRAGDFIYAYYLPWKEYAAASMDLDDKADFFFTSEMTNCRFTVWDDDPKKPKVAHVSGSVEAGKGTPSDKRNTMEQTAGLDASKGRRLSISGGRDVYVSALTQGKMVKTLKAAKQHEYRGQEKIGDGPSSAFVFGQRDKTNGKWSFAAQVVKGNMAEVSLIEDDLTVLQYVYI
jgi:hypothetical protein